MAIPTDGYGASQVRVSVEIAETMSSITITAQVPPSPEGAEDVVADAVAAGRAAVLAHLIEARPDWGVSSSSYYTGIRNTDS